MMLIQTLSQAASDAVTSMPAIGVQGGIGLAMLGALMYAWKQISESNAKQTEQVIASLKVITDDIRRFESARTDATIGRIDAPIAVLSKITEAQASGLGVMQKNNQDTREAIHGLRNAISELTAVKLLLEVKNAEIKPA